MCKAFDWKRSRIYVGTGSRTPESTNKWNRNMNIKINWKIEKKAQKYQFRFTRDEQLY
jgi:hypothetical protein